jgi:2'-5' RNA ligase
MRQTLADLSKYINAQGFKWVRPYNLHVTLVFLGQVDEDTALAIRQCASGIIAEPFELTFDRLSYWSKPKILCLTCQQLTTADGGAPMLVKKLTAAAASRGLETDSRPYLPHITLARHARYLPDIKIEPIIWRAETFCLVESCSTPDGVIYKVRQTWPLIKPSAIPDRSL